MALDQSLVEKQKISALIETLKFSQNKLEFAYLLTQISSIISSVDNPQIKAELSSQMESTRAAVEPNIKKENLEKQMDLKEQAMDSMNMDPLGILKEKEQNGKPLAAPGSKLFKSIGKIGLNLASQAIVASILRDAKNIESKDIYDTAAGEIVRAMEETKRKEQHRAKSDARVDAIESLGELLTDENLSDEQKDEAVKQAAKLKLDVKVNKKTGALEAAASFIMLRKEIAEKKQEIKKKREERRAAPEQEEEIINIGDLFAGDDEFDFEEPDSPKTPTPSKEAPKPLDGLSEIERSSSPVEQKEANKEADLQEEIPATIKESSPVYTENGVYSGSVKAKAKPQIKKHTEKLEKQRAEKEAKQEVGRTR